ncbi:MAG TPA: hypothetical protein VFT64_03450 [Rickettsiales bacterium]|nr:hypothetical protein [Rickettsiales bacterium]
MADTATSHTAVTLNWQPHPPALDIVRGAENVGFQNVVLMGGALRDDYMGNFENVHDYDLWARTDAFDRYANSDKSPDVKAKQIENAIREHVAHIPGATDFEVIEGVDLQNQLVKIGFNLNGKPVELELGAEKPTASAMATRRNSIPICAIAMDATGTVVAHPLFEEHARNKIFTQEMLTPDTEMRYAKLANKIPGLRFQPPSSQPAVSKANAPQSSVPPREPDETNNQKNVAGAAGKGVVFGAVIGTMVGIVADAFATPTKPRMPLKQHSFKENAASVAIYAAAGALANGAVSAVQALLHNRKMEQTHVERLEAEGVASPANAPQR